MRSLVCTLLPILTLFLSHGYAQEYTTWGLPNGAKTRLGKGRITTIAFSPDGSQLAAASTVGIWIYDAQTGKELALLPGYREGFTTSAQSALGGYFRIHALAFSPNGKLLASASDDNTIRVFDITTYTLRYTLYKDDAAIVNNLRGPRITDLAFSADGQTLTTLERTPQNRIKVWDVNSGSLLSNISGQIVGNSFPEDNITRTPGKRSPTSADQRKHNNPFFVSTLSSDGTTFAATKSKITYVDGVPETEIVFGNVRTGELEPPLIKVRSIPPNAIPNQSEASILPIRKLTFSPDGTMLAGISINRNSRDRRIRHTKIRFWYVSTGREVSTVIPQQSKVNPLMPTFIFSPDSRTFASVDKGTPIQLWDINTGNLISSITIPKPKPTEPRNIGNIVKSVFRRIFPVSDSQPDNISDVVKLALHPNGNTLAVVTNESENGGNSSWQLWNVNKRKKASILTEHPILYPSVTNKKTFLCMNAGKFELRNTNNGKKIRDVTKPWAKLTKHFYEADFETFAVASDATIAAIGTKNGRIELWNMQKGKRFLILKGHTDQINALALNADNTILASSSRDRSIRLWDTRTGSERSTLTEHKNSGKKHVFSNAPARLSSELVNNLVFSADSKMLVSSSQHGTIWLWDLNTRKLLKTLRQHEAAVDVVLAGTGLSMIGMAFSPNNRLFASGGMDGKIMLSKVKHDSDYLSLNGHTWSVKTLTFSPDGKILASGSRDKTVRLWNTETGAEIAILRGHSNEIHTLRFSVDGSTLVSGSVDGTIFLWDRNKIIDMDK